MVSSDRPIRGSSSGRNRAQVSLRVTSWPSTARPTTTVSIPVRTVWARKVSATTTSPPPRVPASRPVRSELLRVAGSAVLRLDTLDSSRPENTAPMSWLIPTTTADRPSITFQCSRTVEIAPSRISPMPSGRSGITPGLTAAAAGAPP